MAVIPQYQRQIDTPLTLGAPKQSINAPMEAFGGTTAKDVGAMGDTAGKLGNAMAQIAVQQKEKEDSASLNAVTKKYLDWDRDYQEGIYAVRGADANLDLVTKSKDDRNAKIEELAGELRSPALGESLREKLLHTYNSGQTLTARHIRSQMEDWGKKSQAEVAQGHLDSLTDSAASMAPEEVEAGYAARVLPELAALAKLTGTPVEELIRKTKDDLYTNTVKQAIATGDHTRANSLLERWKDDIDAGTRASLTDNLRKKTIDDTAEDTAFNYYKMLKGGKIAPETAHSQIDQIQDKDTRRATRKLFDAYERQWKFDHTQAVNDSIISSISALDGLSGDLPSQQKFVQSFTGDPKVKHQLEARLNQYKAAGGMRPMTDAEAFGEATDQIISGQITTPEQIDSMFGVKIEKTDREKLKTGLDKMQKMTTASLKVAFTKANGIEGGVEANLTGSKKKNFGEFMLWATDKTKETNRGQEPEYLQKLADMWVLQGEGKGGFALGYGTDMSFQDAAKSGKAKDWLPNMPDGATLTQINELFAKNPEYKAAAVKKFGSEELAVRGYYKKLLEQGIGPRGK